MKIAPARGSDRSDAVDADNHDHLSVLRKRDFPIEGAYWTAACNGRA